ncbi:MAG TPA: ATP synthase F1 subunit delta [Patescibacteria group bacterium]|nr:ATP synthase F1 subunit delta [Patescibacteria group bacterium]
MKITAKQYARALYEQVKDLNKKEADQVVAKFARVVMDNNHGSYLSRIIRQFQKIWNREKGIVEAEVISAHKLDKESLSEIEKFVRKEVGDKTVEIDYKVDANIKGGFVIKMNDKILDASLKTRIRDLKTALVE